MTRSFWSRLLDGLTHPGSGYDLPQLPQRGDAVEAWITAQRDAHLDRHSSPLLEWYALDNLIDTYRLHADTRTPLDQPLPEPAGQPHPF